MMAMLHTRGVSPFMLVRRGNGLNSCFRLFKVFKEALKILYFLLKLDFFFSLFVFLA